MTTKTQRSGQLAPHQHSTLSRLFGFRHSSRPPTAERVQDDSDWYTPYNGPFEIPSAVVPRPQDRDSWTALLNSAASASSAAGHEPSPSPNYPLRSASQPQPGSNHPLRKRMDNAGTLLVGESPVRDRTPRHPSSSSPGRYSFASFLSLSRRPSPSRQPLSSHSYSPPPAVSASASASSSAGPAPAPAPIRPRHRPPAVSIPSLHEGPSFESPYSALLDHGSRARAHTLSHTHEHERQHQYGGGHHPYASVSSFAPPSPRRAPPITSPPPPTAVQKGKAPVVPAHLRPSNRASSILKAISTPNLRSRTKLPGAGVGGAGGGSGNKAPTASLSRWLAPETWCDALLFPRPRFLAQIEDESDDDDYGRVRTRTMTMTGTMTGTRTRSPMSDSSVSASASPSRVPLHQHQHQHQHQYLQSPIRNDVPPPSTWAADPGPSSHPHAYNPYHETSTQLGTQTRPDDRRTLGIPKSRSAVNLRIETTNAAATEAGTASRRQQPHPPKGDPGVDVRRERPRSFARDDLAIGSPVPSLAKVIAAGETLDRERAQWQKQASGGLFNKKARSFSRARSKSVNARPPARAEHPPSSFDVLAARTLLGSQVTAPSVRVRAPGERPSFGTFSFSAHTHSQAHTHTHTHSHSHSHSHSQAQHSNGHGHGRNGSLGRNVLKCLHDPTKSPDDVALAAAADTRLIRLDEQMLREKMRVDGQLADKTTTALGKQAGSRSRWPHAAPSPTRDGVLPGMAPSPVPSSMASDANYEFGIAISTPPPPLAPTPEPLTMPGHPFAAGGYSLARDASGAFERGHRKTLSASTARGSDYAGPHPSEIPSRPSAEVVEDMPVALRHRLPPHVVSAAARHPYAIGARDRSEERVALPPVPATAPLVGTMRRDGGRDNASANGGLTMENRIERLSHAYAKVNRSSGGPLGFEDAMALVRQRRGSVDSGLGDSIEMDTTTTIPPPPQLAPPPHQRHMLPALASSPAIPPLSAAVLTGSSSGGLFARTGSSSSSSLPSRPAYTQRATGSAQTVASSPLDPGVLSPARDGSGTSSPGDELGSLDDLRRYQNMFYRPDESPDVPVSMAMSVGGMGEDVLRGAISRIDWAGERGESFDLARVGSIEVPRDAARESEEDGDLSHPGFGSGYGSVVGSPRAGIAIGSPRDLLSASQQYDAFGGSPRDTLSGSSPHGDAFGDMVRSRFNSMSSRSDAMGTPRTTGSSLSNLTRQLSIELGALKDELSSAVGISRTSAVGEAGASTGTTPMAAGEPTMPLRFHRDEPSGYFPPRISIPEDVESSRASSILEPSDDMQHSDDILRVGTIESVLTPDAISTDHRFSAHLSFGGASATATDGTETTHSRHPSLAGDSDRDLDEREDEDEEEPTIRVLTSKRGHHDSLLPPPPRSAVTDMTRSSVLTSGTSASHISGLSDFPAPPSHFGSGGGSSPSRRSPLPPREPSYRATVDSVYSQPE